MATRPADPPRPPPGGGRGGIAENAGIEAAGRAGLAVYVAAGLSLVAALIHLWAAPEHLSEWWGYGAFFLAAATAQGLFGVTLLRWPSGQLVFLAGIWGNVAIISMYLLTRTYGVPLGPHAGHREAPEILGMAATAAELGLVVALVGLLGGAYRRMTTDALLLLGAAVWVLVLTGVLA